MPFMCLMNPLKPLGPYFLSNGSALLLAFLCCFGIRDAYALQQNMGKQMIPTIYQDERALLNALAIIESDNKPNAIGDTHDPDGPALGAFQIHQKAWDDISALRKANGMTTYPYHDALKPVIAREYATTFLRTIISRFRVHHHMPPSIPVLYACYSFGPSILNKIGRMTSYGIEVCPYLEACVGGTSAKTAHRLFTDLGITYKLAQRKISTGKRMEALVFAHQESLHTNGIPLLW